MKRYIIKRANKAEIRPEEQSEKSESCRANLWNEIQLKGQLTRKCLIHYYDNIQHSHA